VDLREIGINGMNWIQLAQDSVPWYLIKHRDSFTLPHLTSLVSYVYRIQ
jgi:hypothetical protein